MRIVANSGTDRVIDVVRPWLDADNRVDVASPMFSLFAFGELAEHRAPASIYAVILHQDDGNAKPYQVRQVRRILIKYKMGRER